MRLITFALAISLALPAQAQLGEPAPFSAQEATTETPILPHRQPLAISAEIPEGVARFVPSAAARALVNPARAANLADGFVYGTLNQGQVGATALTGGRRLRLLVSLDNGITRESVTSSSDGVAGAPDRRSDETALHASTQGRALLVGATPAGGWALGVFGGYIGFDGDASLKQTSIFRSVVEGTRLEDRDQSMSRRTYAGSHHGVGVEFGIAYQGLDVFGSAGYQHSDLDSERREASVFQDERPSGPPPPSVRRSVFESEGRARISSTASAWTLDLHAVFEVAPVHAVFVSYRGAFGDGTSSSRLGLTRFTAQSLGNAEPFEQELSEDERTGALEGVGALNALRIGYVTQPQWASVALFAGAQLGMRLSARDLEYVDTVPPLFVTQLSFGGAPPVVSGSTELSAFSLTLPVYVRVPTDATFSLFAGGLVQYEYAQEERFARTSRLDETVVDETTEVALRTQEASEQQSSFASATPFVLGALLHLDSGLRAQVAFNGDLAQPGSWTVSLGYHF